MKIPSHLKELASHLLPDLKKTLSDTQFDRVLGTFALLIEEGRAEQELVIKRWHASLKNPLRHQVRLGRKDWRNRRSTGDADAREKLAGPLRSEFAAADSANFTIVEADESGAHRGLLPVTRATFYEHAFAALEKVVEARALKQAPSKEAWAQFAKDLDTPSAMNDWPSGAPAPREFARQLIKDIYVVVLGRRDGSPTAYADAVGALRTPGNVFSVDDVAKATKSLAKQLGDSL